MNTQGVHKLYFIICTEWLDTSRSHVVENPYGLLPYVITPIAEHDILYFITHHPYPSTVSFNMVSSLSPSVWKAFVACILLIAALFMMQLNLTDSYEMTFVYLIGVFDLYKSQTAKNCISTTNKKLLHITWLILIYLVLCVHYNVELHSMLIAEDYTKVPTKLSDLEFPRDFIYRIAAVKWLGVDLTFYLGICCNSGFQFY